MLHCRTNSRSFTEFLVTDRLLGHWGRRRGDDGSNSDERAGTFCNCEIVAVHFIKRARRVGGGRVYTFFNLIYCRCVNILPDSFFNKSPPPPSTLLTIGSLPIYCTGGTRFILVRVCFVYRKSTKNCENKLSS